MSKRKAVLLLVALLIAGLTVILARSMLSGGGQPTAEAVVAKQIKEILVAAKDIPSGTLLKDGDTKWQSWPMEQIPEGYFVKGVDDGSVIGHVVRNGMRAGEALTKTRVVKPGDRGFMASALSPGMRAVSIAISPVAGVAGFVFPGDRIDVIVTHQIGRKSEAEGGGRKVSETVLQNVRVLALDQKMSDQVTEPKVAQIATLEVTPKQAETVTLASELGTLSLALRSIANDPEDGVEPGTGVAAAAAEGEPSTQDPGAGIAIDAAALTLPDIAAKPPELTWDSDVSRVLPRPANRVGAVQKITVIRGKESSEAIYDLTSP